MTSFTVGGHKVIIAKIGIIIFWGTEHANLSNLLDVFLIVSGHIITFLLLIHHSAPYTSSASSIRCCNMGMEIHWLEESSRKKSKIDSGFPFRTRSLWWYLMLFDLWKAFEMRARERLLGLSTRKLSSSQVSAVSNFCEQRRSLVIMSRENCLCVCNFFHVAHSFVVWFVNNVWITPNDAQ